MVDALVTVAAEAVLTKALSIIENEVSVALGYKEKLTELHGTLEMIRAKLRDADGKKSTQEVMVWLKQLKSVVDEADDVLDEVDYETLRREVKKRYQGDKARKILCFPNLKKFSFKREMGHKIENINKKLSQIYARANNLKLEDEKVEPAENSRPSGTVPYLDEFKIVGRENDELRIVERLTNSREGERLTIVPIVGMGGIGKTTLAKSIYNSPKIVQHFKVRAWVCVSVKVSTVDTLLASIYESLAKEKSKSLTTENLIENLKKKLESERYLIVLDDVWDEELAWDEFRKYMGYVNSGNGSGIIVTTRKQNIGRNAAIEDSYALKSLSDDDSWDMFKERALPLPGFEKIGRDIVKKCRGLPLLVDILGSMLRRYNTDKGKWLSILQSEAWDADEKKRVVGILKLSFDNLPDSMVKQCFVYCSIFEKDEIIYTQHLVHLWMALGLVTTDTTNTMGTKEMEDVGKDIIQILANNSLFQNVTRDQFGDIDSCQMHDLVHDLLLSLSTHETLRLVVETNDQVQIPPIKHLALYQKDYKESFSYKFREDMATRTLRTLFFLGGVKESISLQDFKFLRILKFCPSSLDEIPESIGELVHLRYLELSQPNNKILPKSIGKLYQLQTLNLNAWSSIEFPQEMRNLISLRHLWYDHKCIQAPEDVGLLTSLQAFPFFKVGQQKGRRIEELGPLKHLRGTLQICNLEAIGSKEEAVKADLHGKQNLYKIEFNWSSWYGHNRNDKDVLEGLQPAANVKILEIEGFSGDSFPEWAMNMKIKTERNWIPLANLVRITLSGCRNCVNIPILEDLQLLQDLVLMRMHNVTCLSSSSDQTKPLSPSLKSLELCGMDNLEKWTHTGINSSTMLSPVLEKLTIYECPKIINLDESLQHPLVYLAIAYCKSLESVGSMQGLTSLQLLRIRDCHSLSEIPDMHNQGCSLKNLAVKDCNKLTCLPEGLDCLFLLQHLELGPFSEKLDSFPSLSGIIEKLGNTLSYLQLKGWEHWESIPEDIQHLNALDFLSIDGFGVRELPMWLKNMSSVREIVLNCKGLSEESVLQRVPRGTTSVALNGKWIRIKPDTKISFDEFHTVRYV